MKFGNQLVAEAPGSSPSRTAAEPTTRSSAVEAEPERGGFETSCSRIREPKKRIALSYADGADDRIEGRLLSLGLNVRHYEVDVGDYRRYVTAARYVEDFPNYYPFNRPEKALEHYLAARLLELHDQDVYIDVASEHSPAPDIYGRLFGVRSYRQDQAYSPGAGADVISGDAAHMPVPDGFVTKMALHCSFEHFEGDADIGFLREAARVLRPGGAVCIVPLYLFEEYAIQTDPEVAVRAGVVFEEDATVYCARGWGNRHARFYDPERLATRVYGNLSGMAVMIYVISGAAQVDPPCYVRFALLIQKPH